MATATLDYTLAAPYYDSRADYSEAALQRCFQLLGLQRGDKVCDVGAGTGKLTVQLGRAGLHVQALEPCQAMRERGVEHTSGMAVEWRDGMAEALPFDDGSFSTAFYGKCWHLVDQERALAEARRVAGSICCVHNTRDKSDPLQAELQAIVRSEFPDYRSPQVAPHDSPLVTACEEVRDEFCELVECDTFLDAWRSWPYLQGERGERVLTLIQNVLDDMEEVEVPYTTVAWTARFC